MTNSGRGGKREGAGRPEIKDKKVILPFRVYESTIPEIKKLQKNYEELHIKKCESCQKSNVEFEYSNSRYCNGCSLKELRK